MQKVCSGLCNNNEIEFSHADDLTGQAVGKADCVTLCCLQVDFFGYTYEQCMVNYKILQQSFNKLGIERVSSTAPACMPV